jgi:hypothetical protein
LYISNVLVEQIRKSAQISAKPSGLEEYGFQ